MIDHAATANTDYFSGIYKDIWRGIFPQKTTIAEVDFIIEEFRLKPQSKVLDLMCGHGRHSLELAKRGIQVTAVDSLPDYIDEIEQAAIKEKLNVKAHQSDAASFTTRDKYDAIIIMGNSLQFFDRPQLRKIIELMSQALNENGSILINTWSIAEIAFSKFQSKSWGRMNDVIVLSDSQFLLKPSRIETESTFILKDGTMETKLAIDYIYSLSEYESLFHECGLTMDKVYSIPGKKPFELGDPRAYIIFRHDG